MTRRPFAAPPVAAGLPASRSKQIGRNALGAAGLLLILAGVLAACLLAPSAMLAQAGDTGPQLLFSTNPKEPTDAVRSLRLRPNVTQEFFLYVKNTTGKAGKLKVDIQAGDKTVLAGSATLTAKDSASRVAFEPAAPTGKPPVLAPVTGVMQVRLLGDKGEILDKADIRMGNPDDQVEVEKILYYPGEIKGKKNTLEVILKAKSTLAGPPCRVELVLRPDRIPALLPGQAKEGSFGGYLTGKGSRLILEAQNLQFKGDEGKGLVYLTIDGYERAITYYATFARQGGASTPQRVDGPILRLNHALAALPSAKYSMGLEVDNVPAGTETELGLYRTAALQVEEGGLTKRFVGDRQIQVLFGISPDAGLLFEPKTRDWTVELDTSDIFGRRFFGLRLVDAKAKAADPRIPVFDSKKIPQIASFEDIAKSRVKEIVEPLILDGTPPQGVTLAVNLPPESKKSVVPAQSPPGIDYTLPRGAALPLKATAEDPESGIAKVVFFAGKLPPDGKLPANAVAVDGARTEVDGIAVWLAELPVATEKKGTVEASVLVTNGVGLTTSQTIVIQLVDAPAGGAVKTSIEGTVMEGDRLQPNLDVVLRDDKGVAKDTTKTDKTGRFVFQDVPPGSYKVTVVRTASMTRGEAAVQILAGQKKTLTIQLRR